MPWSIEKRGSEFCVIKDSDGTNEGCHPTRAEARRQQRALYASEAAAMTVAELNIITRTGEEALHANDALAVVYTAAVARAGRAAVRAFRSGAVTADAWVPATVLPVATPTSSEAEQIRAEQQEAADLYWLLVLAPLGLSVASAVYLTDLYHASEQAFQAAIDDVLRQAVLDAQRDGLSLNDTVQMLQTKFVDLAPVTARMLARTQLTAIASEGALRAASEVAKTKKVYKTWRTQGDGRVRPAHSNAFGQTVPLAQPFTVGGFQLMYPGDPSGPLSMIANCRCFLGFEEEVVTASAPFPTLGGTMSSTSSTQVPNAIAPLLITSGTHVLNDFTSSVTISVSEDQAEQEELTPVRWQGVLTFENAETSDGRFFAAGAWSWRDLPLTLMAQLENQEGHRAAQVAGRIDRIWKIPASEVPGLLDSYPELADATAVMGEGELTSRFGVQEVAGLVEDETVRGVSVDFAVHESALRDRETGELVDPNEVDALELLFSNRYQMAALHSEIGMATIVGFPAFAGASLSIVASAAHLPSVVVSAVGWKLLSRQEALTAAAAGLAPLQPPREWFEMPEADEPTPLTVTEDGQVYGHAALFGTCHIGNPAGEGVCVEPPLSQSGYAYFHQGTIQTAEGDFVPVGKITINTGHASVDAWTDADKARAHYDNTGTVGAFVRASDGVHGIWVCGTARSDAPAEVVRDLRAAPVSGDWRNVRGVLEMVGLLAVPVPGFPIPRVAALVSPSSGSEERMVLLAAGMMERPRFTEEEQREIEELTSFLDGDG